MADIHDMADVHLRQRMRKLDVHESYLLLLEMVCQDPVLQYCFKILQGTCLSNGIHVYVPQKRGRPEEEEEDGGAEEELTGNSGKSSGNKHLKKESSASAPAAPPVPSASSEERPAGAVSDHLDDVPRHRRLPDIPHDNRRPHYGSQGPARVATTAFQEHLNKYFIPFCEEAIRLFFVCGFVPWRLRKLEGTSGDVVPEVLPLGTFSWSTELLNEKRRREQYERVRKRRRAAAVEAAMHGRALAVGQHVFTIEQEGDAGVLRRLYPSYCSEGGEAEEKRHERRVLYGHPEGREKVRLANEGKYVSYRVTVTDGGLDEEELFVYEYTPPRHEIAGSSILYSTVASPLAGVLVDYKNLRQGLIRRSHADAWNTQARIMTTTRTDNAAKMAPAGLHFRGVGQGGDALPGNQQQAPMVNNMFVRNFSRDTVAQEDAMARHNFIRERVTRPAPGPHTPMVYTLPVMTESLNVQELHPVEDCNMLLEKYTRDVALLLGIPPHFVVSHTNLTSSHAANSQIENLHQFINNTQVVCKHLERLLSDVHMAIYGEEALFSIVAQPRVAIENIQDIKDLVEMGLMLPRTASQIVDMLLQCQNLPTSGAAGGQHAETFFRHMIMAQIEKAKSASKK
jgi:hypothetical protein